jgi:hypothetical protein
VKKSSSPHKNLQDFLSVGSHYENILMLRKIDRSVEEFKHNQFLQSYGLRKRSKHDVMNQNIEQKRVVLQSS